MEYESVELAKKAVSTPIFHMMALFTFHGCKRMDKCLIFQVAELKDEGNWRIGLRVRLMLRRAVCSADI